MEVLMTTYNNILNQISKNYKINKQKTRQGVSFLSKVYSEDRLKELFLSQKPLEEIHLL